MPKQRVVRHEVVQPLDTSYRLIPLTQGQNAIVDALDFEWLSKYNWYAQWCECTQSFYARRHLPTTNEKRPILPMHREILGCSPAEEGDHKNHDTLDNRRNNLRKCTRAENIRNREMHRCNKSGFKGVSRVRNGRGTLCSTWRAVIRKDRKRVHIGCFATAKEAAAAYDQAAKTYFGDFAHVNFQS